MVGAPHESQSGRDPSILKMIGQFGAQSALLYIDSAVFDVTRLYLTYFIQQMVVSS